MLFSKTPAKTENFEQNLSTVEENDTNILYRYAVYLNHEKFIRNEDPGLKNNVGSTDRAKKYHGSAALHTLIRTPLKGYETSREQLS